MPRFFTPLLIYLTLFLSPSLFAFSSSPHQDGNKEGRTSQLQSLGINTNLSATSITTKDKVTRALNTHLSIDNNLLSAIAKEAKNYIILDTLTQNILSDAKLNQKAVKNGGKVVNVYDERDFVQGFWGKFDRENWNPFAPNNTQCDKYQSQTTKWCKFDVWNKG